MRNVGSFQEDMLMTKADLVEKIAAKANLTKAAAERALNAFLASVEDALVKDAKLTDPHGFRHLCGGNPQSPAGAQSPYR